MNFIKVVHIIMLASLLSGSAHFGELLTVHGQTSVMLCVIMRRFPLSMHSQIWRQGFLHRQGHCMLHSHRPWYLVQGDLSLPTLAVV